MLSRGEFVDKWKDDEAIDLGRTKAEAEYLSDYNDGALQQLSVTVNNERYKII